MSDWHTGELAKAISAGLEKDKELTTLRALCRRVAEHLGNEHHIGLKDPETNAALIAELERAGWDEKGKER